MSTSPTSAMAYREEKKRGTFSALKDRIVAELENHGPATAAGIADAIGSPRDSISPRMAELVASDVVEADGYAVDPRSGHRVKRFRLTGRPAREPKRRMNVKDAGAALVANEIKAANHRQDWNVARYLRVVERELIRLGTISSAFTDTIPE